MPAALRRYRAVIGPARNPVLGYMASGISVSLKPLAAVFLLREAGREFDLVGFVLAAEVLGVALGMLVQGRLIDRFGPQRLLPPLAVIHVAFLLAFVAAVHGGASVPLIIGLTLLWGLTQPVLLPSLRAMWGTLFSGEQRDTAYAVQAVLTEVVFVLGPLTAATIAFLASPTAALITAAGLCLFGVFVFGFTIPRRVVTAKQRAAAKAGGMFAALHSPQLRTLVVVAMLSGVTGGAIEILLPVLAESDGGDTERAGIGFGVMAIGSIAGGLIYGARRWRGTVAGRFALFTGLLGLALIPLIATPSFAAVCGILLVAGFTVAPAEACLYSLIDDAADDATVVEANSWITALYTIGLGAGTASGGLLVSASNVSVAAAIPAGAALISVLVILGLVRDRAGPSEPPELAPALAVT